MYTYKKPTDIQFVAELIYYGIITAIAILVMLCTGCSIPDLNGNVELDIPGDHNFGIVLRDMAVPKESKELRSQRSIEQYGFDMTEVYSAKEAKAYFPGEKITVPVEQFFCLDCPTVPQYGIQPFFEHYEASKLYAYQLWHAWQQCLANVPPPVIPPANPPPGNCGDFKDGGGGALWKPIRDGGGNPVFLLPTSYCSGTSSLISNVRIVSKATGKVVTSTSFRHCGKANGGRLHQNVNSSASEIAKNGPVLVLYVFNGKEECREVPNATTRYD